MFLFRSVSNRWVHIRFARGMAGRLGHEGPGADVSWSDMSFRHATSLLSRLEAAQNGYGSIQNNLKEDKVRSPVKRTSSRGILALWFLSVLTSQK